jgi:hypothetical protein
MYPAKPPTGSKITLQDVLERLAAADIGDCRRRDLRSAVTTYAKLLGQEPKSIAVDLTELRRTLDRMVPAEAQVSRKRWANLRSDLTAAIDTAGLVAMLKTAGLPVDSSWEELLEAAPQRVRTGLSRFSRWATLRQVSPERVNDDAIARFTRSATCSTSERVGLPDGSVTLRSSQDDLGQVPELSIPRSRAQTNSFCISGMIHQCVGFQRRAGTPVLEQPVGHSQDGQSGFNLQYSIGVVGRSRHGVRPGL